jgi:hypothetical protein
MAASNRGRARPFSGVHCETVATGTLLRAAGFEVSEPMLFGLGEGLASCKRDPIDRHRSADLVGKSRDSDKATGRW